MAQNDMEIKYSWNPSGLVTAEILEKCSNLYSAHYGCWSEHFPDSPGKRIKLSASKIREWIENNKASLYQACVNNTLIGYAIALKLKTKHGAISWVTQLVVHEEYRKKDVAKTLLFSIWRFSNHFAWGVITANPYAIRALEKATRRRCHPGRISKNKGMLLKIGKENITYIRPDTKLDVRKSNSAINTKFFVDHSSIEEMIRKATSNSVPWLLGNLEEGWEWFAFTFNDQEQLKLTNEEIEKMISVSDQITKQAYSRMQVSTNHKWQMHTEEENSFIISACGLPPGSSVLDIGCGLGRHSIGLAKRGYQVTGVDYIPEFINLAKKEAKQLKLSNVEFMEEDGRIIRTETKYDIVICLYDVVGSFVEDGDNKKILESIACNMKSSGVAIISVMNYELTRKLAKNIFSFAEEPDKLLDLEASQIMEKTGDIFDPNHYIVDEDTHIVYRKEQFTYGKELPTELIVRDRRFTREEIISMCEEVGLEVKWANYVGAGKWSSSLSSDQKGAKEILLLCRHKSNA